MTQDPEITAKRFMDVASMFHGFIKHKDFLPADNHRVQFLQRIHDIKRDFTVRDVWAMDTHNELFTDSMYDELFRIKLLEFTEKYKKRTDK